MVILMVYRDEWCSHHLASYKLTNDRHGLEFLFGLIKDGHGWRLDLSQADEQEKDGWRHLQTLALCMQAFHYNGEVLVKGQVFHPGNSTIAELLDELQRLSCNGAVLYGVPGKNDPYSANVQVVGFRA